MRETTFTRYLTEREEKQLWNALKQRGDVLARRDYAWMRLLRHSGMRIGSLAGTSVADAREALHSGTLHLRTAKRGQVYSVPVTKAVRSALVDLLAVRQEQGHVQRGEDPLVMSRQAGRGLSIRAFQQRMAKWIVESGLQVRATPHWFRHTIAKRIIARSTAAEPLRIVQGALGHASIANTAFYTRPDREEIAEAMEVAS